jgi:putative addiction module CopG family antidote
MATMMVSLPDPVKDWIEGQIRSGEYASASDYVRDLVRATEPGANRNLCWRNSTKSWQRPGKVA